MGNFSSKDSHGPTGAHGDSFHTPSASPQSDGATFNPRAPQILLPTPPLPSSAAPVSSPPPVPVITSSAKVAQSCTTQTPSSPPPEWTPHPPPPPPPPLVRSNSSSSGPGVSLVHSNSKDSIKRQNAFGTNGSTPSSTSRTLVSQGQTVDITPTRSVSLLCSASPVSGSSLERNQNETDKRLSQPLLVGPETGDSQDEELAKLLEECKTTLGIAACQDEATNTAEILQHLLTEVKSLKSTLQVERGEWMQFQADLQVAVSVADRLRAEAEEELSALRKAHEEVERELAAVQQRQKETDMQLVTLGGELKESKQRLATLTQAQVQSDTQAPCPEPERPNGEPAKNSELKEGSQRGRERGEYRLGKEGVESRSQNELAKNVATEEARTDCKGVAKRYLRNMSIEDKGEEEPRSNETQLKVTTERSRSLSRLPASPDSTVQNGTSQSNTASTVGPANNSLGPLRSRRSLDRNDSRSNTDTGKREESLNKYNSALTELPPIKPQDGFNLLLRRHGGSKRNSLLRWCQNRTQGYKSIDITNFSSSWSDGLAFCAVYHTYLPLHIPYSSLTPENKRENLSLAFKTGETVGIAQTLTVDEMLRVGGPDWQRVLSYVETIYRHFEM